MKSVVVSSLNILDIDNLCLCFSLIIMGTSFSICWSFQWTSFQFQWFFHFFSLVLHFFHFDFYYFSSAYFGLTCSFASNFLMKKLNSLSWDLSSFNIDLSTIRFPLSTPLWHPPKFYILCFHFYSGQNAFQFHFWLLLWSMGIRNELHNNRMCFAGICYWIRI